MRLVAHEQLSELAADLGESSPAVRYLAASGPTAPVLCAAAEQYEVDVIVLPRRRAERLRRLLRVSLYEQLRRQCRSEIVVAPCSCSTWHVGSPGVGPGSYRWLQAAIELSSPASW